MTDSKALTKYTPMDLDELDAQEKEIGFGSGRSNYYEWKDGKNTVRFLPGLFGNKPFVPFWKHFVKGAGDGKAYGCPCPAKMAKQKCWVCIAAAKLSRGSDADRTLANDIGARSRVFGNLVDRAAPDAGPQLAEFGKSVYDPIKDILRTMGEDPTDPMDGFDLIVEKQGSGLKTEYKLVPMRKNSPLHVDPAQAAAWMEEATDLSRQIILPSEAEQLQKLADTVIGHMLSDGAVAKRPTTQRARAAEAMDVDDLAEDDDLAY